MGKPKAETLASYLARKYGGKWSYKGQSTWECDDKVRFVQRVLNDMTDYDGGTTTYLYYRDGRPTECVNL